MARPSFYFCACPDAGLTKAHIEDLIHVHPPSGAGLSSAWQRHVYWGDEELPQSFWKHLTIQGLFNTPILLIVRNAQNIPAATWKLLSKTLATSKDNTWLILCLEVGFEKKQAKIPAHISKLKCFEVAKKQGFFWQSSGLDSQDIKRYIQNRAKVCKLNFAPDALEAFCTSTLPDATAIEQELQKLILLTTDGNITLDMISTGAYIPDSNVFAFISFIQAGNITAAWNEIYKGQKDVAALLFPFLGLLSREARTLWQILAKEQVYIHFSVAKSKESCAHKLGFSGVAEIFSYIVHAEQQVKSGECDPEQALESMVVNLVRLFSRH